MCILVIEFTSHCTESIGPESGDRLFSDRRGPTAGKACDGWPIRLYAHQPRRVASSSLGLYRVEATVHYSMDRQYVNWLAPALVGVGLGLLLFAFFQAYYYAQNPPPGTYNIVTFGSPPSMAFNGRLIEAFTFVLVEFFVGATVFKAGLNLLPKVTPTPSQAQPKPAAAARPSLSPSSAPAPAVASPAVAAAEASSASPAKPPIRAGVTAPLWSEDVPPSPGVIPQT